MGRTLRLIACFILVALSVSHDVQGQATTCWDRCVDACRDEKIGLTCVPQCFYGNCLNLPTGIAVPQFIDQKNRQVEGQPITESKKAPPPELTAYAQAPKPSSSEQSRKLMKNAN